MISSILFFILGLLFLLVVTVVAVVIIIISMNKIKLQAIMNFEHFAAILYFHMERAYEIIYKDRIVIYSIEGVKLTELQYQIVSKDFVILVLKMVGPNIKKNLVELYGDDKTLMFNIMEYFNTRFEHDEIYKTSEDNIRNTEVDTAVTKDARNSIAPEMTQKLADLLGSPPLSGLNK